MRRIQALIILISSAFLIVQCTESTSPDHDDRRQPEDLTTSELDMVQSTTDFSFNLFREVLAESDPNENIFISPLSISFALGMTYNGAAGETREAIANTLEMNGMSIEEVNEAYRGLIDFLVNYDPQVIMEIANSIWYRQGEKVDSTFIELNKTYFDALVKELDFNSSEATDIINEWVNDNTHGKIEEIIDSPINPMTVMFLINAIYFKADWRYIFDENDTQTGTFTRSDSSKVDCRMMSNETDYRVMHSDQTQAIRLPYGRETYCMTVLLPDPGVQLQTLVDNLDDNNWTTWQNNLEKEATTLYMPKFKFEYETGLNTALKALGMEIAFNPSQADFSNMFPLVDVYIDSVIHKTFVQVDEKGTEAAAVTAVEVGYTSGPNTISIDRSFIFVIHERVSGAILFMGRVANPVWED
ncbi:serpin family protein [Calditrichota bacterium]